VQHPRRRAGDRLRHAGAPRATRATARAALLYQVEDRRVQAYFLGGKYPRPEDAFRLYEVLRQAPARALLSAAEAAERAALGERRAKAILAWLHAAGAIERRQGGFRRGMRALRQLPRSARLPESVLEQACCVQVIRRVETSPLLRPSLRHHLISSARTGGKGEA
jgi:hypothetical protein